MDILVIIPILALLSLSFVAPGKDGPSLRGAAAVWIVGLLAFVALRAIVPERFVFPDSEVSRRVRAQVRHLLRSKDWRDRPIIILEGSSLTQFGVDGEELERGLAKRGLDATVLQFSLSGANHLERLHMLDVFLGELSPEQRESFRKARVLLLGEVSDSYDENPLFLFEKEAYTGRSLVYLGPSNALAAWRAYRLRGERPWAVFWPLVEHAALNEFCVGVFSDMRPPDRKKRAASFFALTGTKGKFDYAKTIAAYDSDPETEAGPEAFPGRLPYPQWVSYYELSHGRLGDFVDHMGFFALPSLEAGRRLYQTAFAAHLPPHTAMIGPPARTIMERLRGPGYWFDGVHPQGEGAKIFTGWLADEIVEQWPLLTSGSWQMWGGAWSHR